MPAAQPPASSDPKSPSDVAAVKRQATIITFAILSSPFVVGGAFHLTLQSEGGVGPPIDLSSNTQYIVFVVAAAALAMAANAVGARMRPRDDAERAGGVRRALRLHIISLALGEAAALLGLVGVLHFRTWTAVLPATLGLAAMLITAVRSALVFSSLEAPE